MLANAETTKTNFSYTTVSFTINETINFCNSSLGTDPLGLGLTGLQSTLTFSNTQDKEEKTWNVSYEYDIDSEDSYTLQGYTVTFQAFIGDENIAGEKSEYKDQYTVKYNVTFTDAEGNSWTVRGKELNLQGGADGDNYSLSLSPDMAPSDALFGNLKVDISIDYSDSDLTMLNYVGTSFSGFATHVSEAPSTPEGSGNAPEPTTATLSLLALASLAARRRRK